MKKYLKSIGRIIFTLVVVAAAVFVIRDLWSYYMDEPWTRDAHVRADVVEVAPDISGLVDDVLVHDNSTVHRGDVLFSVDRQRFAIALLQAEAAVAGRQAALDQARRELVRSQNLGDFASRQRVEQTDATVRQAEAAYQQALADRELAKLNLARSDVKASVSGIISNLSLQPGDYVSTGKPVMALINTDTVRVEGYFEETKLHRIHIGDRVTVHLMSETTVIHGIVEGIAGGIEDRERSSGTGLLADINPTFTWVRLAQRIPVRIKLDNVPSHVRLVSGLTATVQVGSPVAVVLQ